MQHYIIDSTLATMSETKNIYTTSLCNHCDQSFLGFICTSCDATRGSDVPVDVQLDALFKQFDFARCIRDRSHMPNKYYGIDHVLRLKHSQKQFILDEFTALYKESRGFWQHLNSEMSSNQDFAKKPPKPLEKKDSVEYRMRFLEKSISTMLFGGKTFNTEKELASHVEQKLCEETLEKSKHCKIETSRDLYGKVLTATNHENDRVVVVVGKNPMIFVKSRNLQSYKTPSERNLYFDLSNEDWEKLKERPQKPAVWEILKLCVDQTWFEIELEAKKFRESFEKSNEFLTSNPTATSRSSGELIC